MTSPARPRTTRDDRSLETRRRPRVERGPRVLLIGARTIHRDGLRVLLEAGSRFRVVGSAGDCVEAVAMAQDCRPDVVLLDLGTDGAPQRDTLHSLAAAYATARILVVASALEKPQIVDVLRLGVRGVVLGNVNADVLFRSIRVVADGQFWIDRALVADLVQSLSPPDLPASINGRGAHAPLTVRELEIISLLAAGETNRGIAGACGISERTVKHHLTNIFNKVGVSNRLELAVFALEHRLVASDRPLTPTVRVGSQA